MARPKKGVPWLKKRGNQFYACWYDPAAREAKRVSLRTGDEGEARSRFAAFLLHETLAQPRGNAELTVSGALDDYWKEHASVRCANPRRQEDAIRHLKAFFVDAPLSMIDIPTSRRYADARRGGLIGTKARRRMDGTAGDSTVRRELNVLVAAANHARKWKRFPGVVSVELPPERRLGQDDEAVHYTRDEVDLLIDIAGGDLRHFITLAYYTGARRASIEDLTRPQVKWEQKKILLQKADKRATKKRQPIVPIFDEMVPSLEALWSKGGEKLFGDSDFYRPFHRLCAAVGMEDRAHPHLLRHSRATHLLQAGASIYDVSALLGDTPSTIVRVYGHHSHDHLAEKLRGL